MKTKTALMQRVERRLGENLEDYLRKEHKNTSMREMGRELNVDITTIINWLKHFNMYRQKRRDFSHMSDRDFMDWVKINYNGISSSKLRKKDTSVAEIISKRGLSRVLDHRGIILAERRVNGFFREMSNKQLINFVEENYQRYTISRLQSEDGVLLSHLRDRGLLEQLVEKGIVIRQQKQNDFYTRMTDRQLVHYTRKKYRGNFISEVERRECALIANLRKRKLIEVLVAGESLTRKARGRNVFSEYTVKDFIEYIRKNHYQKTLTEICEEEKSAYRELKKRKLDTKLIKKGIIILKDKTKKGTYSNLPKKELFDLIEKKYNGMTLAELDKVSQRLCILAREKGILERLITKGIILKERQANGYWTKETTYEEGKVLYLRLGFLPQQKELKDYGVGSLSLYAKKYFCSYRNLRRIIENELGDEIEQQRLENLVTEYVEEG